MKARVAVAIVLGTLVTAPGTAFGAPPESAAGPPRGGCPAGGSWVLADPQPGHFAERYDFNGDTFVCGYFSAGGGFAVMDNVVR